MRIDWGRRRGPVDDALEVDYESVFLDGQEISLYDFVHLSSGDELPFIGLVVRLWENRINGNPKVTVRWLYRPQDCDTMLDNVGDKELFLALGSGDGAEDNNDLAVVERKVECKLLYYPEKMTNWQPTKEELGNADYYVARCYDFLLDEVHCNLKEALERLGAVKLRPAATRLKQPAKKKQVVQKKQLKEQIQKKRSEREPLVGKNPEPKPKRPERESTPGKRAEREQTPGKLPEQEPAPRRVDSKLKNAFKQAGWKDRLDEAFERGKVILLMGFGTGYTSPELKEALVYLFPNVCQDMEVSIIPPKCYKFDSKRGEAVLAFRDPDKANHVLDTIQQQCVILSEEAGPCIATVVERPVAKRFPGHLPVEKYWRVQKDKFKEAVSTAHCSQPNTIEYEMALEWRLLHEEHRMQIQALRKKQQEELADLKAKLGMER